MATRKASKSARKSSAKRAAPLPEIRQLKKKRGFNPHPLPPPVEHQFKPGQSGNPGGRPKLMSGSYAAMLARVDKDDPLGRTNAEVLADSALAAGKKGDIGALREIRQATEGTRVTTWQDDVVKLLKEKKITRAEVEEELGVELAEELTTAAGLPGGESGEAEAEGGAEAAGSGDAA